MEFSSYDTDFRMPLVQPISPQLVMEQFWRWELYLVTT